MKLSEVLKENEESGIDNSTIEENKYSGTIRLSDLMKTEPVDTPEFDEGILEIPDDLREKWKAQGPIGFFEQAGRIDKTEMIPFWGGVESTYKSVSLLNSVNRIKEDKYADEKQREDDMTRVKNFLLRQEEERTRGVMLRSQVLSGVSQLPAFMVEFMATGGAAALGKQATKEAATFALRKGANIAATKLAARIAAPIASAAARTLTVQQAPRIAAGIADRMVQSNFQLTEKGAKIRQEAQEAPFTSVMKGFGDVLIENYSEQAGEVFLEKFINKGVSYLIPKKMAASMEKIFTRFKPGEKAAKLWTAAGYNGFLAEMGEERLGAFLRAVTGVEDFGADNPDSVVDRVVSSIPNGEQLLVEAGVLAVPGLGRGVAAALMRKGNGGKASPDTTRVISDEEADIIAGMGKPGDEGQAKPIDIQVPDEIKEAVKKEIIVGNLPESGLRVANIGADGKIYVGDRGELHFSISEKHAENIAKNLNLQPGDPRFISYGFVDSSGKFYTREEAVDKVKGVSERLDKRMALEGGLDAADLRDSEKEVGFNEAIKSQETAPEAPQKAPAEDTGQDLSFDFGANLAQDLAPSEDNPAISRLERKLSVIQDLKEKADRAKEALGELKVITDFLYRGVNLDKSKKFFSVERLDEVPSRFKSTKAEAMSLDEMAEAVNEANLGVRLESDDQLIDFMKSVVAQESRLKQIVEEGQVQYLKRRETTVLKQRIKDLRAGQRAGKVMAREEVQAVQSEIRQLLLDSELDPKDRDKFAATMKNTLTQEKLEKILPEIERKISALEEKARVNSLKERIESEIKATKVKKQSGKPVGKFTAEIQEVLDSLRSALKMSKQEASDKITENLMKYQDELPPEEVVIENKILSIAAGMEEMSSAELSELLQTIIDVKAAGRTLAALLAKERRAFINDAAQKIVKEVSGGKGLTKGASTVGIKDADETNPAAATWKAFLRFNIFSWDNLLNYMALKSGKNVRPGESFLERFGNVFLEGQKERAGRRRAMTQLGNMVESAYNVDSKGSLEILRKNAMPHSLGVFTNKRGEKAELILSKDQAIKKYMEMLDPTLEDTFSHEKGMAWTDEIKNAVTRFLTAQDKKFATKQLEFYRSYYNSVNAIYRKIYGTNLPFNEFYSPIRREGVGGDKMGGFGEFIQEAAVRRSLATNSMKTRVKNVRPLAFTGSTQALEKHVEEMERFKAWAEKIRDLHAVFGNQEVKQAIYENQGSGTYKSILRWLEDFARGGVHKSTRHARLDQLRTRFTQSKLGIRPKVAISQLTGTFAYLEELSAKDFTEGVIDFWKDPVGNYKKLKELSVFLQLRGENIDRDIKDAIMGEDFAMFRAKPGFINMLMTNVSLGDKGAIIVGGWALYQSDLKKGMSKEEAIRHFEEVSNRIQQSGDIAEQNEWQRGGSFAKLFSMFLSNPNQYLRREVMAVMNAANKKIPVKQAAKTIFVYHFLMPMIFQFVSDFFQFKPERQLRAAALGSLNGLFVIGDFLEWILSKAMGIQEGYGGFGQVPITAIGEDLAKALFAIDWEDITLEDVWESIENLLSVGGSLSGLPLKEFSNMVSHLADIYEGNYLAGIGGMLGWGESVLDNLDSGSAFE